jgi:nucleotide-binding universal stress UspA family protein
MQAKLIAVATDFSANADEAVQKAFALARRRGAEVLLVHVIPSVLTASPLMPKAMVQGDEAAINDVAGRLEGLSQDELEKRYLKKLDYAQAEGICLKGKVVRSILSLVKDRGVDLLVVGATGSAGLAGSLFGTTATKLLRKAPCSVLVVRCKESASTEV